MANSDFSRLRFSCGSPPQKVGPATPLVLICYWDPTRKEWMPQALCRMFNAGDYRALF